MFSIIMQCQKNVWIANWALVRAKRKRLKVSISEGFSFKGLDWYVPSQFESINIFQTLIIVNIIIFV